MPLTELAEILGNLGEFIGSIAVILTLIYVAVQVRYSRDLLEENRKMLMSQVYHDRASLILDAVQPDAEYIRIAEQLRVDPRWRGRCRRARTPA